MTNLFSSEAGVETGDLFEGSVDETPKMNPAASQMNLAAQGAVIEGADLVNTYKQLSAMEPEVRQATLENMTREAKNQQMTDSLDIVSSIIQDPLMSEDQKSTFVNTLAGISAQPVNSLDLMAETMYVTAPEEQSVEEATRFQELGEVINPIMELQKAKQRAINTLAFNEDTGEAVSLGNNLGDAAELFLPFTEQVFAAHFRSKLDSGEISTPTQIFEFFALGEGKQSFKEGYESASLEDRMKLVEGLPKLLNSANSILFMNDQDLLQLDMLMTGIDHEHYGNFERTVDDIVGLLDVSGLGWLVRPFLKLPKALKLAKVAEMAKAATKHVRSKKQSAAPMPVAEQVSPEHARTMAKMVDDDPTGEAAKALTGTDRSDALADIYSPQLRSADGTVEARPVALDRHIAQASFDESGKLHLNTTELEATRIKLLKDTNSVGSLVARPELTVAPILRENGSYDIGQTYTLASGGFTSPELAIKEVLESLAYYGVKEDDITLLRRSGNEYKPVSLKDVQANKVIREELVKKKKKLPDEFKKVNNLDDYAVEVDFHYSPRSVDIVRDGSISVKLNWMDRFNNVAPTPGKSTASRQLLATSYMLDPNVYQGSVAAVDQGQRLLKVLADEADTLVYAPLRAMEAKRVDVINQIISEQSLARKNYSLEDLAGMGITDPKEIAVLDGHKKMNDQLWHLTNQDMAKTLRDTGHSFYVDAATQDKFIGKVMNPNTPLGNRPSRVYNPTTKSFEMSSAQWEEVATAGGKVMELRAPQMVDDIEITHIVLQKNDTTRHIQPIQLDDVILPYIPGYVHTRYLDNWFIERQLVDSNGNTVGKVEAILTSPNAKSANKAVDRFTSNASIAKRPKGNELGKTWKYTTRPDVHLDPIAITEKHFEVASSAGLSSQRHRGQTLKSFDSTKTDDINPNIANPLDTLNQSIQELAKRIPLREYLDDLQQRILETYKDVLPKNDFGQARMPAKGEKLGGGSIAGSEGKMIADLRTNLEHFNFMKFGYHNSMDHAWRAGLNRLGQIAGQSSSRMEHLLRATAEEVPSPTGALKAAAFNLHISASAPPSQWLVQGVPAFVNGLLHPEYAFKGGLMRDWRRLVLGMISKGEEGVIKSALSKDEWAEVSALTKEWDRTGLGAGIDKHLLVEGGIEQIIETARFAKTKATSEAVFGTLRNIGFNKGEAFNLGTSWLAARNDAIKSGKDMGSARDFAEVRAKARQITMNMNRAGEMPWNKNSMSLWTQFMVSPYKSLTMILDRGLNKEERIKIAMWNTMMMPLPIALTYEIRARVNLDGKEGEVAAELITNGLMGGMFNTAVNAMWEGAGSASFQRIVLADYNTLGPKRLLDGLLSDTGGVSVMTALAQASPSLSLFAGYNPIALNLAKATGKLIASPFKYLSDEDNEAALRTMEAFAGPNGALWQATAGGRGLSTAWKELFVQKYEKRYSALSGKVVGSSITRPEIFARAAFGLETTEQTVSRAAKTNLYLKGKEARDDIDFLFKNWTRMATDANYNIDDPRRAEFIQRIAYEAYDGDMPLQVSEYIKSKLAKDTTLLNQVMRSAKFDPESAAKAAQALRHADPEMQRAHEYFQSEQAIIDMREDK